MGWWYSPVVESLPNMHEARVQSSTLQKLYIFLEKTTIYMTISLYIGLCKFTDQLRGKFLTKFSLTDLEIQAHVI